MPTTPEIPQIELAHFKTLTGSPRVEFDVHFNPESLEYSVANTLKEEGQGAKKKQFIDKSTAKLTMQLVFDTTDSGEDVRTHTDKVAKLLKPVGSGSKQVPPNVEFITMSYSASGDTSTQTIRPVDLSLADPAAARAAVDTHLSGAYERLKRLDLPKSPTARE